MIGNKFKEMSIMWKQRNNKLEVCFVKGEQEIEEITELDMMIFGEKGIGGWIFELDEPITDEIKVLSYIGNLVDNLCSEILKNPDFDISTYSSTKWKPMFIGDEHKYNSTDDRAE